MFLGERVVNRGIISALIHMDMTYLGAIDIHISLNKLINTTFYTEIG